ncbi:MAG: hypothetical protein WC091_08910 [Sulfuricellaceae bacterium]
MHVIEFETISHQHIIRLPDSVPDGVPLRVLLLSQAPFAKPVDRNLKTLLASITEGMTEADTARLRDLGREAPEWAS